MKRIEAVVRRSELYRFFQCAESLGIFGFDLCECREIGAGFFGDKTRIHPTSDPIDDDSRLKVDFAVLDSDTKDILHTVLERVHPDSIAVFILDQEWSKKVGPSFVADH